MTIEFTDDDVKIIKELIFECDPYFSRDKLRPLAEKLGVWEPEQPPTKEQLEREEEFRNSPMGKLATQMFVKCEEYYSKEMLKREKDCAFINGSQWDCKIGTSIKIRLPIDYKVKE